MVILISRVAILYYSKCPLCNKKIQDTQRNRKVWPILRKKKKQSIETVSREAQVLDLLDKDVKSAIAKVARTGGE